MGGAISPGEVLYLADGLVRLRAREVRAGAGEVDCDVEVGGAVATRQGLNIPGPADELPAVSLLCHHDASGPCRTGP